MSLPLSSAFQAHDPRFHAICGPSPTLELIAENASCAFAHEAGIFIPEAGLLFVTSNRLQGPLAGQQSVQVTRVHLNGNQPARCEEIFPDIPMANGGVNHDDESVLICGQGSPTQPSGLYRMSLTPPYHADLLVGDFYGRPFNSVNDVVVHPDGSVWFTDPIYGFEQGYRAPPSLPSQVYRWNPANRSIRAMADGLARPNGICFSPDYLTVYVTDTDFVHGDGSTDPHRVSSIYAYDHVQYHGEPFLANRRLFAMADTGAPDGIKCDQAGNVYSGCGDGIHVWSPGGTLLGRILIEGGIANFCFGIDGELFALNEHRLWRVQLNSAIVKGALLGI